MPPDDLEDRVRSRILDAHRGVLRDVIETAEAVASRWDDDAVTDRDAVVPPLERELGRRGHLDRLPRLIADGVAAAGYDLSASPVAAPPYVVIASTGPVLRATVSGGRLVIGVRVFEVARGPPRYGLRDVDPDAALDVTFVPDR